MGRNTSKFDRELAYRQGYEAAQHGMQPSEAPFYNGTLLQAWFSGFEQARRDQQNALRKLVGTPERSGP